jgi:hypothetical protein
VEAVRQTLSSYYLELKTLHLLAVAMWSFSTAVAFRDYVIPAFRAWFRDKGSQQKKEQRDYAIERFDHGAQLEHWAFPVVLVSGGLLVWIAQWPWHELNWLTLKLGLVLLIFIPMEAIDYYISHFGGNKARIRRSGDMDKYERMVLFHWKFFRVTTPLVIIFIPLIFYLAVTKPL